MVWPSRTSRRPHRPRANYGPGNELGLWIAPDRGILVWTPVILLLLPALVRSWKELPDWSRALVWGGFIYPLLQGRINGFQGGDLFYGYRYGLEMLTCVTPALALSAPRIGGLARRLIGPVLAVQLLAIAIGSGVETYFLPEDQARRDNAFVHAVNAVGVGGWAAVVLTAFMGVLVARIWTRSAPSQPDREGLPTESVINQGV